MVLSCTYITVGAREASSGVIDFTGTDGTVVTSRSYSKYLSACYNNLYIKDNAAVTYATRPTDAVGGQTMNFTIDAGKLLPTFTNGGVITYKFKFKWKANVGTPTGTASIKFGPTGAASDDLSNSVYFGVGAINYANGLTVTYGGKSATAGDKWSTEQTAWTNGFCDIEVKVDLYGNRLGFKEAQGQWYWVPIDTATNSLSDFWQMGIRCGLGTSDKTIDSDFYVDDISVSYTTAPADPDTGAVTFEEGIPGEITAYWGSTTLSTVADPKTAGHGKVLKAVSDGKNAAVKFDMTNLAGSGTANGKLTYQFDIYSTGNNVFFYKDDAEGDAKRLGVLTDSYLQLWTSQAGSGPAELLRTDVRPTEWQTVKITLDRKTEKAEITLNGNVQGTVPYTKSTTSGDFKFVIKTTNTTSVEFYIDNFRAYYSDDVPTVGEASHTWLGGVTASFDIAMNKASVENGVMIKDTETNTVKEALVSYNETTKQVKLVPTEALDPSKSYILYVGDTVKSADGIYIADAVSRSITLETLSTPSIADDGITLLDKNGVELVSRVKIIKAAFNVPMDETSLKTAGHIMLSKSGVDTSIGLAADYDINDNNSVTLTLSEELEPNSTYALYFTTGCKRIDGVALSDPIIKTINTPVLEQPEINADGAAFTDVSANNGKLDAMKKKVASVTIPFTVALDASTVKAEYMTFASVSDGTDTVLDNIKTVSYDTDSKAVTVTFKNALDADTAYKLTFGSQVKAVNGEDIKSDKNILEFTTGSIVLPKIAALTATTDGSNYAAVAGVADINAIKAEFNYALSASTVSADTVKLEKWASGAWSDTGATFAFDGTKIVTWTLPSGETFPEGTNYRISIADTVKDIYGDLPEANYSEAFVTKQSTAASGLTASILGKTLTFGGKLMSGTTAVAKEKLSVLVYKQGGTAVPFGADSRYFEVLTSGTDGSFNDSILLYDDESAPKFEELWLALDAQSMGKSNQRDARVAFQYSNALMDEAGIADLKRSAKQVFTYITEAADSDEMKAIVTPNGLTAVQNKKLYEGMGVWVSKYTAMTDAEKAAANAALDSYKQSLTTANVSKILNATLIATDLASLSASEAAADIKKYDDEIESITVEGKSFGDFSQDSQLWIAQTVKANNPTGFASYEVFVKEVKKCMLLDMISQTAYTELADLFINNKTLVNDGLSENKLSGLESETSTKITDAAMSSIKTQNKQNRFTTTTALADAIKKAVEAAQSGGGGSLGGLSGNTVNNGNNRNESLSIGGMGGTTTTQPNNTNNTNNNKVFNDLDGYGWAETAVLNLYNKGIVSGTGSGGFEPSRGVTREEFCKMLCEAFGLTADALDVEFEDVNMGEWYAKYITIAYSKGIVNGMSEKHFGVGSLITREDMAVMILRAIKATGKNTSANKKSFADSDKISDYAREAVEMLSAMGIISGVGDNRFAPADTANRAEAAVIINRCL